MSNTNKHIEEFLDYYLNVEQSPDYAVLITGCWGSGKTYFIRQYLGGNRKEVKEWLTDCEKYVVVYVSLFGAKSREEMDKRVLETLHPKLNSKIVKAIPGAVSLIGKIVGTATANPFVTIAGENIAVFSDVDVVKFCEVYKGVKRDRNSTLRKAIEKRYEDYNRLEKEKEFLERLLNEAKREFNEAERPLSPSVFSLHYLIRTINKILGVTNDAA